MSATVEDVYCLYCNYEEEDIIITTNSIGRIDTPLAFKFKRYVNPKVDICIICMNCVASKSNCYLTECGHTFHKTCLSNYFHHIQLKYHPHNLKCPLCRANLGYPEFHQKYNYFHPAFNSLDLIENINDSLLITNDLLHICRKGNQSHYLGLNNDCQSCLYYRKEGVIL